MVLLEFHYWSDVVMGLTIYTAIGVTVVLWVLFVIVMRLMKKNDRLKRKLDNALSGVTLPPEVQAKVDKIFKSATATKEKLNKGISDNQTK